MSRSFNKISAETRTKILTELQLPGCSPTRIAKTYNISRSAIYTFQKQARGLTAKTLGAELDRESKNSCSAINFIEVPIIDIDEVSRNSKLKNAVPTSTSSSTSKLSKASLTFNDCSIVLEGRIRSSSLIAIIQILEN